jgi:hypothetical protein
MVFNTTFNNISALLWGKPEYPEKTTLLKYGVKQQSLTHKMVSIK